MQRVRLDHILGLAALAVDALVEPARRAVEVGDDEAAVAVLERGLDARDDPPLGRPGLGGIGELAEATHVVGLALDAAHGGILGESGNSGQQDRVAGEPVSPKT